MNVMHRARVLRDRPWRRWSVWIRYKTRPSDDWFTEIGPLHFPFRFLATSAATAWPNPYMKEFCVIRVGEEPQWIWLKGSEERR
jgi:hypothetical protein